MMRMPPRYRYLRSWRVTIGGSSSRAAWRSRCARSGLNCSLRRGWNSVERPEFYRVIVPTTWQEGAAGFHGKFGDGFQYELYGLSMPDAHGFTGSNGIRGGRGKVGEQIARDWGVALDWGGGLQTAASRMGRPANEPVFRRWDAPCRLLQRSTT